MLACSCCDSMRTKAQEVFSCPSSPYVHNNRGNILPTLGLKEGKGEGDYKKGKPTYARHQTIITG